MSTNLATVISGPCLITHKGATFRSKGDVRLDLSLETFDIITDLYQVVDKRVSGQPARVTFTPEGRWEDLTVLFPYGAARLGSFVTPVHECGAVDTDADTIEVADTSLPAGTPVSFGTTGTMPTGLDPVTVYYLGADSSGERTVHATSAHAIAGTNDIDLSGAGTGTLSFVEQWPVVIHGNDGTRLTLHNAAVVQMPTLNLKSTDTLFGECVIEGFVKNGVAWSTANSLFTIDSAAFSDSGFDPSDILTQPHTLTWGSSPWANLYSKEGITVEFQLALEPVEDDASGVITRRIASLAVTARAQPMGPTLSQLMEKLGLQGSGAVRGRSLSGDNLDIAATGVFVRLNAAALIGGPAQWSTRLDRIGELTWQATRTFSNGEPDPLFLVDTAMPT